MFDGYDQVCLKEAERNRWYTTSAPDIAIERTSPLIFKQEVFLANSKNKTQFIKLLTSHLTENGFTIIIASDDADSVIVEEAVRIRGSGQLTAVVGEDIDLLILIIALADAGKEVLLVKPAKGNVPQKLYSS